VNIHERWRKSDERLSGVKITRIDHQFVSELLQYVPNFSYRLRTSSCVGLGDLVCTLRADLSIARTRVRSRRYFVVHIGDRGGSREPSGARAGFDLAQQNLQRRLDSDRYSNGIMTTS
jgi:hypothetical protein